MKTPQIYIEKIVLGEATANDFPPGRDEDGTAEGIGSRVAETKRSNEEILAAYDSESMRRAVEAKLAARKNGESNAGRADEIANRRIVHGAAERGSEKNRARAAIPFKAFMSMAAAACLIVAVFVAAPKVGSNFSGSGILASAERAKGDGPHLYIFLKDGERAIALENGDRARANDIIQMSYGSGGQSYGAILSIDGNGTVTWHYPDAPAESARLSDGGETVLGFSYQLDDAPKFERFFFVTGKKPFTLAAFVEGIRKKSRDGNFAGADVSKLLPKGTEIVSITLQK